MPERLRSPTDFAIEPIRRALWLLGFAGFVPRLVPQLHFLRPLLFCFVAVLVIDVARWARRRRDDREPAPAELPLPGPAARGGPLLFLARYHLSTLLMLLNPFQLAQLVRQGRGQAAAVRRSGKAPSDAAAFPQSVRYRLPFAGEWIVMNGGITPETSHSWDLVSQRYAYDFAVADGEGRRHRGDGRRCEEYLCYGQPVLAPAAGTVVRVRDGVRDAPRPGTGWVDWLCRDFGGNSVTIRHADGEYSHLAHLLPGSIAVRPGDQVRSGQAVGRCGNSGHSTEPHLHCQLQDHPDFFQAVGLPIAFADCGVDGAPAGGPVQLRAGMRAEHRPSGDRGQAPPPRTHGLHG